MQADKLRELRALLAKATPGPWESDTIQNEGDYGDGGPDCKTGFKSYAIYGAAGLALLDSLNSESAVVHEETDEDRHYAWDEVARRNAALVVAAVNALPELLAIAEGAEADRADAVGELQSVEHSMKAGGQTLVTYRVLDTNYHAPMRVRIVSLDAALAGAVTQGEG